MQKDNVISDKEVAHVSPQISGGNGIPFLCVANSPVNPKGLQHNAASVHLCQSHMLRSQALPSLINKYQRQLFSIFKRCQCRRCPSHICISFEMYAEHITVNKIDFSECIHFILRIKTLLSSKKTFTKKKNNAKQWFLFI